MSYSFPGLVGGTLALDDLKGKVVLIVNTASKCGFTPQYAGLEQLYQAKRAEGLVVIGVPCDDFGGQEPGDEAAIGAFCQVNYGVTFPMTTKQHVVGSKAHPFFAFAGRRFGFLGRPKWNFHKYLIGREGELVDYFQSTTAPDSSRLRTAVARELAK